jgi:hypothetical protein
MNNWENKHRNVPLALGLSLAIFVGQVPGISGCAAAAGEGIRASEVPPALAEEYALFSQRCSKCHSLSRALASEDKSDLFWQRYVTRMRRQPASGISVAEEAPILRFLHWYGEHSRGTASVPSATISAAPSSTDAPARGTP